jgi:hypothetical protein
MILLRKFERLFSRVLALKEIFALMGEFNVPTHG